MFWFRNKFIFSNLIVLLATKPKSAIDDLFADADSEEDSDDIFSSSKNVVKKHTKEPSTSDNDYPANVEDMPKRFLDVIATDNIATSTPESNINVANLFSDDDDADLFGNSKQQSHKPANALSSTNSTQELNKKKPVGGEWILGNVLASDIESKLSSRIMQQRQESSESDSDASRNSDSTPRSNVESTSAVTNRNSQNLAENISVIGNTTSSSGISMQPHSITDSTAGSSLWYVIVSSY